MLISEIGMGSTGNMEGYEGELGHELKMQDMQIEELTRQIQDYEQSNEMMRQQAPKRGRNDDQYQHQFDY